MRVTTPILCLALLSVGCGQPEVEPDPVSETNQPTTIVNTDPVEGPTFRSDIRPILDASCSGCHDGSGVAPHDFSTFETVKSLGPLMLSQMQTGAMPPWALADDCGTFLGDIRPSADDLAMFKDWVDGGMLEGGGELVTVEQDLDPPLDVGFTLDPGEDYASKGGAANDDYRCFIMEPSIDAETFVTGMQVHSTTPDIVHHVILYSISSVAEEAKLAARDEAEAGPGYTCFGGPGTTQFNVMAAWAPGDRNVRLPQGTGVRVKPNRKLVVQIHYSGAGTDRTTLGISTDDAAQEAYVMLIGDTSLTLPPGNPEAKSLLQFSLSDVLPVPVPVQVRGIFPHMHLRGRQLTLKRTVNGVTDCLVDAPNYDFNWQRMYEYAEPVRVGASDQLSLECVFDTTDAEGPVRWGDNTTDEMCVVGVYATL